MSPAVLSHYSIGSSGRLVRWLPGPAPVDRHGSIVHQKMVVIAHWNDEMAGPMVSFANLTIETSDGGHSTTQSRLLATHVVPGVPTDIDVAEVSHDEVLVAVATAQGSVAVMRASLPRMPGSNPEDINFLNMPVDPQDPTQLQPQYTGLHGSAVTSVDVQASTKSILTSGEDGVLCVFDVDAPLVSSFGVGLHTFKHCWHGAATYTKAKWADANTFTTVDVFGQLCTWDLRVGPRPTATAPREWSATAASRPAGSSGSRCCWWVDVHSSRPHLAATGEACGRVAIWDLRFKSQPVSGYVADDLSDVWQVRFDPMNSGLEQATPGVVFCTEGGLLGAAKQQAPLSNAFAGSGSSAVGSVLESKPLYTSPFAINSFDIESHAGKELVALTDNNALVYMYRD